MNTKKITFGLLVISLVGWGTGVFLLKFYDCGNSIFCYNLTTRSFALYYGMPALAFIFFILIFTFYPDPASGDYFSPYPEQIFKWVSILYVVISILIVALKTIRQRTEKYEDR